MHGLLEKLHTQCLQRQKDAPDSLLSSRNYSLGRDGKSQGTGRKEQVPQKGLRCPLDLGAEESAGWSKEVGQIVGELEINRERYL